MLTTTARRQATTATEARRSETAAAEGPLSGTRRRRHGAGVPFDREELERSGWRTTLDYRENHVRRRDGRLDHLEVVWFAEAERTQPDGSILVVSASAHTPSKVWVALRREADLATCRPTGRAGPGSETAVAPPPRRRVRLGVSARRTHRLAW